MSSISTSHDEHFSLSSWIYATRPKTFTATFVPIFVGTAYAFHEAGSLVWTIPICALLSALFIQIGMHFTNDAIDFRRGTDTKERLGPMRPTIQGLLKGVLTPRQVMGVAIASFAFAILCGLPLMAWGGIPILLVLIISVLLGYCYTGGPFPISYLGVGELFVVIFYGLVATGATYALQTQQLSAGVILAGTQIGLLTTIMLAINNLRDWRTDGHAGRRTVPIRFGITAARWEITLVSLLPFVLGLLWIPLGQPAATLLPLATLPLAILLCRNVWKYDPAPIYNQYFAQGALLHLTFGILLGLGLLMAP